MKWRVDLPELSAVFVIGEIAFEHKDDITVIGGNHSIPPSLVEIGALAFYVPIPSDEYCMNILKGSDTITNLVIGTNACPFENATVFDLSVYPKLKTLKIGSESFEFIEELKLIGLSELESVVIGNNSFVKSGDVSDPDRHFYVKDCPKLKSLTIGRFAFSAYSVIEIENVDALETIEIGIVDVDSSNFEYGSLELKSTLIHKEWWLDMPSLKSLAFGWSAFQQCSRVVFESDFIPFYSLNRLAWTGINWDA